MSLSSGFFFYSLMVWYTVFSFSHYYPPHCNCYCLVRCMISPVSSLLQVTGTVWDTCLVKAPWNSLRSATTSSHFPVRTTAAWVKPPQWTLGLNPTPLPTRFKRQRVSGWVFLSSDKPTWEAIRKCRESCILQKNFLTRYIFWCTQLIAKYIFPLTIK